MAKILKNKRDEILSSLQKSIDQLLLDPNIIDPFDYEEYENLTDRLKKHARNAIMKLVDYYHVTEEWNVLKDGDIDFFGLAGSIYRTTKSNPIRLSHPLLKAIGGYLESDWYVFVPFTSTVDIFDNKNGAYQRSYCLGGEYWIMPIQPSKKIISWIEKNLPYIPPCKIDAPKERASLFEHQMCQIGGGRYEGDLAKGHYFVFRCKGSLRGLDAEIDPSKYFALFAHGLTALRSEAKSIFDPPLVGVSDLSPEGLIGVNLKNLKASRTFRHTNPKLKVRLSLSLLKDIRTTYFEDIVSMLFKGEAEGQWAKLKTCADILYQYIENESQENNYIKTVLSTVLLCSAGEALLDIAGNQAKKRKFSNLLALLYAGWDESEFEKCKVFLMSCYKIRSDFVHEGVIDTCDNTKLFTIIFLAWQKLSANQIINPSEKYSPSDYIKGIAPQNTKIYRTVFISDFIG